MIEVKTTPPLTAPGLHVSSEAMSLALDGVLEPAEQRRFDVHVQDCELCHSDWVKWQDIADVLQVEPFLGPAPGFALRLDRRLREQQRRRERFLGGLVLIGGTVSIWTLLLMGVVLATVVTLLVQPGARLDALAYFGFGGQLVALVVNNLSAIRDGLLAILPSSAAGAAMAACLLVVGLLWTWLVFYRNGRNSGLAVDAPLTSNGSGQPASHQ